MADIGTTAVPIQSGGLIQNLGPDPIYVGESAVTSTTGVRIAAGDSLVVGSMNAPLLVVSEDSSDVRFLGRAMGIFFGEPPA
jgi:hypothetical protein